MRGMSQSKSNCEKKYTVMRGMSQSKRNHENDVHKCEKSQNRVQIVTLPTPLLNSEVSTKKSEIS